MFKIGVINKNISMIHIQVLRYQIVFSYQDKYYQITGLEFLRTMQGLIMFKPNCERISFITSQTYLLELWSYMQSTSLWAPH